MRNRILPVLSLLLCVSANAFAWQDEPAVPAKMVYPIDVAADKEGVVYVADRDLPGVWSIKDGRLSLLYRGQKKLRTPLNAIRCLAIDKNGDLLAGDSATRAIYRFKDGKPVKLTAGREGIGIPVALAVNSMGEILAADLERKAIWKVPASGGAAEILAKTPAPRGLAVDKQDRIWVLCNAAKADQLIRIDEKGELGTVVAGQPFRFPHQLVLDDENTAFVSDGFGRAVWKIVKNSPPKKLCSGGPLKNPVGLTRLGVDLLVADPRAENVFRITPDGEVEPLLK